MLELIYRGYAVRFRSSDEHWSAHIRKPGGLFVMRGGFLTATLEEGQAVLLERAKALIDQDAGNAAEDHIRNRRSS
jgi:hypothetical protein